MRSALGFQVAMHPLIDVVTIASGEYSKIVARRAQSRSGTGVGPIESDPFALGSSAMYHPGRSRLSWRGVAEDNGDCCVLVAVFPRESKEFATLATSRRVRSYRIDAARYKNLTGTLQMGPNARPRSTTRGEHPDGRGAPQCADGRL